MLLSGTLKWLAVTLVSRLPQRKMVRSAKDKATPQRAGDLKCQVSSQTSSRAVGAQLLLQEELSEPPGGDDHADGAEYG